jgi:hypothetical protein
LFQPGGQAKYGGIVQGFHALETVSIFFIETTVCFLLKTGRLRKGIVHIPLPVCVPGRKESPFAP